MADLRAANVALGERLDALEAGAGDGGAASSAPGAADETRGRPSLAVVHIGPAEAAANGAAGEPAVAAAAAAPEGPRPVIKGDPNGVEQLEPGDEATGKHRAPRRAPRSPGR